MASTLVIDLRHYLDENGQLSATMPVAAKRFAESMTLIAEAGTAGPCGAPWGAAAVPCRQKAQRRVCGGRLVVLRTAVPAQIEWRCPRCLQQGFLSGFAGSRWDLAPGSAGGRTLEERVSFDELAALLKALAPDPAGYRVVVGARTVDDHAVINVPREGLVSFLDSLATAHARNKTQRKLLDAVSERLSSRQRGIEVRAPIDTSLDTHGVRGRWRIVEMELWGRDYLDMEVDAFIDLGRDDVGSFQFGLVRGDIDYAAERDGRPGVEWSWVGADENDDVAGRGWAVVNGDELRGRIYFHRGDDSAFVARREAVPRGRPKTPRATSRRRPVLH